MSDANPPVTDVIVKSPKCVTLVGAGETKPHNIDDLLTRAPSLVAADGGAAAALEAGHLPDTVIGDFDSLPQFVHERIPAERLHEISEQDSTDFEKCLRAIKAPLILALGFTGRRTDHELAVYNALARHSDQPCIVLGQEDLVFVAPADLRLDLAPGTRVSLFPMSPVTGLSEGLKWPIDGLAFAPDGRVGTSNQATGPVRIQVSGPGMLVILPVKALEQAMAALLPGSGRVPGR